MEIVVPFVVAAVALGAAAILAVRAGRKRREMSEADQQRMAMARQRIRKSPVRYLSTLATVALVLATTVGTWSAWLVASIVLVGALALIDRNRRKILRKEGFTLTRWGDPDYGKGTSR